MKMYKATILAAALAAASLSFGGSAGASPVGAIGKAVSTDHVNLQQVDWRPYRHCHWRHGRRWCHGGRRHSGYYGPGVSLYFGRGWGHRHHHHRHHGHHHFRRHHRH